MKKLPLLIIVLFTFHLQLVSQGCLSEGIAFTTQLDIDNFQMNYPACTEIEGDVLISGFEISNLEGLDVLTGIGGKLEIFSNSLLSGFSGLDNLEFIGGHLQIVSNPSINSLEGLHNIQTIGGDLFFRNNDSISAFNCFLSLQTIEGSLTVEENNSLTTLNGLNNLEYISESLFIQNNENLSNTLGLNNLLEIGGSFWVYNNVKLESLDGIESLQKIGNSFKIQKNDQLTEIGNLYNLSSIGEDLLISENSILTDIDGLENIDSQSILDLFIIYNELLSECSINNICNYLVAPNGSVNIDWNGDGCESPTAIAESCGINLPCLPYGNYYFNSQADLENFATNYSSCNNLNGSVLIRGQFVDLSGLEQITSVEMDLSISWSNSLVTLEGLGNLESVGNNFSISGCESLKDISDLNNLSIVNEYLVISSNDSLKSLSGLENINADSLESLIIRNNRELSGCAIHSICEYLDIPYSESEIYNNGPGCETEEDFKAACDTLGVEEKTLLEVFRIAPNPCTGIITINTFLEKSMNVEIELLDLFGNRVKTILSEKLQSGKQEVVVNLSDISSGTYLCNFKSNTKTFTSKLIKL